MRLAGPWVSLVSLVGLARHVPIWTCHFVRDLCHGRQIGLFHVLDGDHAQDLLGSHLDLDLYSLLWSLVPWNSRVSYLLQALVEESVQDLYCPEQRKSVQAQTRMEVPPLKAPC